jgi:multiple sugar transport system permease protein
MLNPLYGIVNHFFQATGLSTRPIEWLESPSTDLPGVAVATIWTGFPLVMVLVLAGLQGIPNDLYEAAELDGASRRQVFRHVTLPGLAPVLLVVVILQTVWWFKHYTIVWLMTAGGPVDATNIVSISIYRTAFQSFDWGDAAARASIIFVILLVVSAIYRRTIRDGR